MRSNYRNSYIGWNGLPVKKNPINHPYSYDEYVIFKDKDEFSSSVYSDRLYRWDYQKYNTLCNKHFGDKGQLNWNSRDTSSIENFFKDWYDNPDLKLVGIIQGCNLSDGYPYWIFLYD